MPGRRVSSTARSETSAMSIRGCRLFSGWQPRYFLIADGSATHPPRFVEVRYLLQGGVHISSYVHKHIFDNPITSLQARVIRVIFRYAVCVIKGDMKWIRL